MPDTLKHKPHLFHRTAYARDMAQQLLRPTALQVQVRSGVFLSGIRRIGKTTFLRQDLIPELETIGVTVIYVDLWADRAKPTTALVLDAIRNTLRELDAPGQSLRERFKGLNIGAAGFSFGFQIDAVGRRDGVTLAEAITAIVDQTQQPLVLVIDEIQDALSSDEGQSLLFALKSARDAVNTRPDTPAHFLLLATGSHKSMLAEMALKRSQPFAGAVTTSYEPMGVDFVRWKLQQLASTPNIRLPSESIVLECFQTVGCRPEELQHALLLLQSQTIDPDQAFPVICATLATRTADVELCMLEGLGELAVAVFDRIASMPDGIGSGLYGSEALTAYEKQTGLAADAAQVQNVVERLVGNNLILRLSHGKYAIADPLVQQCWLLKKGFPG